MITTADTVQGPEQGNWTYEDYAAMPDDGKRYQIVDGVLFMSPSPNTRHQDTVGAIFVYLWNHVNLGMLGRVYTAPFDVELASHTICQPDVIMISRHWCRGAIYKPVLPPFTNQIYRLRTSCYNAAE
jgi:hypothetical protein